MRKVDVLGVEVEKYKSHGREKCRQGHSSVFILW